MKDLPFKTNSVWPSLKEDQPSQLVLGIFVPEQAKEIKDKGHHLELIARRVEWMVQQAKELGHLKIVQRIVEDDPKEQWELLAGLSSMENLGKELTSLEPLRHRIQKHMEGLEYPLQPVKDKQALD